MKKPLHTAPIWDDELQEWNTTISIPELADFDASAEKFVLDRFARRVGNRSGELFLLPDEEALPAGTVPLIIHNRMLCSEPTSSQQDAIVFLTSHRRSLVATVLESILSWYITWSVSSRAASPAFPNSSEDINDLYPPVDTPEGLRPLIKLEALHVHEASRGGACSSGACPLPATRLNPGLPDVSMPEIKVPQNSPGQH
jgi:hypothetical protein